MAPPDWRRIRMSIKDFPMLTAHWPKLVTLLVFVLTACSGGTSLEGTNASPVGQFTDTQSQSVQVTNPAAATKVEKIFAANSAPNSSTNNDDDYRIAPLDVIEISVFGIPDLTRTVQVNSSGTITLPLIREVSAGGHTASELEHEIEAKLEKTYLHDPQITVYIKEFNSQRITVDGAVKNPGIFPIVGKTSLLQTIALAGGPNEIADPSGILVFRTVEGRRMAARFDLRQIRSGKQDDPQLKAGDVVMVDESATRTTLRDVKDALPLSGLFSLLLL
jgi:polysaccharide biosynthesis/export protein